MGKIVKLCSACDEGFAEKFVFCPNCGSTLQAFEMNPVQTTTEPVQASAPEPVAPAFIEPVAAPVAETENVPEVMAAAPAAIDEPVLEIEDTPAEPTVEVQPVIVPEPIVA